MSRSESEFGGGIRSDFENGVGRSGGLESDFGGGIRLDFENGVGGQIFGWT